MTYIVQDYTCNVNNL